MRRAATWVPALLVALGAIAATAHGLYEVAVAARVPSGIAWLYPVITDGLALVAYAATSRLTGAASRYAWVVVVLAAGLSGLAQAMYLARPGDALLASPELRFGVGAWPAVAAAVVAHLLYLLATEQRPPAGTVADLVASRDLPVPDPVDVPAPLPAAPPAALPASPVPVPLPAPVGPPAPDRRETADTADRDPAGTATGMTGTAVDQREQAPTPDRDDDREAVDWARSQDPIPGWRLIQREHPGMTETQARKVASRAKAPAQLRSVK